MKNKFISVLCAVLIFSMVSTCVFASSNLEDITDKKKLELLTLSEIVYEIPSKTFWTTSYDDNYNIIAGNSIRVIELNGGSKKSMLTICPQDKPLYANESFVNHSISYNIALYNKSGEKIEIGNSQKKVSQYKTTFTCKGTNYQKSLSGLKQWFVRYNPFTISLPAVKEKTQVYLVVEPSDSNAISEIKTANSSILKPNNNNLELMNEKIYYDFFEIIKNNVDVISNEFLDKIHPGKMYIYNNKTIYWKTLIRDILGDYTYAENNEDAKIEGWGFFAATFLNKKDKTAVIAYRGTEFPSVDVIDDAVFAATWFKSSQMSLANKYYKYICDKYEDYEVLLAGHSLGGALANSVTFENMKKMITYTPVGVSSSMYGGPVSIAFNGGTQHILDSYPEIDIYSDSGNYVNFIANKFDILNSPIVGIIMSTDAEVIERMIAAGHISLLSYVPDISELSEPKTGVHGLAGMVMYENGKFSLSPTAR